MAMPSGSASRAVQCAANIRIGKGWLQAEPLTAADEKIIREALAELEAQIAECRGASK